MFFGLQKCKSLPVKRKLKMEAADRFYILNMQRGNAFERGGYVSDENNKKTAFFYFFIL